MRSLAGTPGAYTVQGHDAVRARLETGWFARLLPALVLESGGRELLDLGCANGAVRDLADLRLARYTGVDLTPPPGGEFVAHDLRDGLGPVGARPFHVYLGTFGVASHVDPAALRVLLGAIAAHARPGALVALEALGLRSLEWPGLWSSAPGRERTIAYRLGADVSVHPWAPEELFALYEDAGIEPLRAHDRTLQAGPKLGEGRYWPGLPDVREGLNALLAGAGEPPAVLSAPLPPLPAGEPARLHHELARLRASLVGRARPSASAVWQLDPPTRGGFGHGLLVVGRVRA